MEICKRIIETGRPVATVVREVGISENTIYTWISRYKENNVKPFVGKVHCKYYYARRLKMDEQQFLVIKDASSIDVLDENLYCYENAVFTLTPAIQKRTSDNLLRKVEQFIGKRQIKSVYLQKPCHATIMSEL